jgi:hypothetical protein
MKLTPVDNFIKLFRCNLHGYWCIALSFDSGYAPMGINYAVKSFMKLTPDHTSQPKAEGKLALGPS